MNFSLHSPGVTAGRQSRGVLPTAARTAFSGRSAPPGRLALFRQIRLTPGPDFTVRRVRAGDADAFQAFVQGLSPASRRMRFHGAISTCSPALLDYLTQAGNPRHQAWLAFDGAGQETAVVGEARFVVAGDGPDAEFAIAVADDRRGRGIADRLLQTMVQAATQAGIGVLFGDVLEDNARMFRFLRRHHFEPVAHADVDPGAVRWQRRLGGAVTPSRSLALAAGDAHLWSWLAGADRRDSGRA
jgi:GNAT superfamily N-acetyltransferase